jgi:hypothetical protein
MSPVAHERAGAFEVSVQFGPADRPAAEVQYLEGVLAAAERELAAALPDGGPCPIGPKEVPCPVGS